MKNKLPTITIGIPAYNEEANIGNLLADIANQVTRTFKLKKIVVACDSPSDNTLEIVRRYAKRNKKIKIINGRKRLGQTTRLGQLFSMVKTDYLVCFDADVALTDPRAIEKLLQPLKEKKRVGLVGANLQPAKAENLFEQAMNTMFEIWYKVRLQYQKGNNIYSHLGAAFAVRRELAHTVHFPSYIVANQHYLYISVLRKGYHFAFAREARVLFRSPSCFADYHVQATRPFTEKAQIFSYFGEGVKQLFETPASYKAKAILLTFLQSPLLTSLGLTLFAWIRVYTHLTIAKKQTVLWDTPISTKRAVA